MLRLMCFLFFLILSVYLGIEIVRHPGFLLVVYQPWMVQLPIWLAVLGVFLAFILFYFLITSVDKIYLWWFQLKNWLRFRKEHQSYSKTQHGLSLLIEGRWQKAERLLLAGMTQTFEPLINFLGAAKAAQAQAAYERRDSYIEQAYHMAPESDLAIGLTLADLQLEQHQLEQALATLNHLRSISPYHPRVLKLLEKVYVRLGDWKNLQLLLPSLYKAKIFTSDEYTTFEKNIYFEILRHANPKDLNALHAEWDKIPRSVKKQPDVVYAYVKHLLKFSDTKTAEELIRSALKNGWHAELVLLYSTLPFVNLNRQLVIGSAWLKTYGQRQELLLMLGRLCMQIQLWGKAKDYFEKCLAQGPNIQATLDYGKLLEKLNEYDKARECYQQGLLEASKIKKGKY